MNRHTKRKKDSLIVIQGNRCAYCGKWMPIGTSTLDHIIPKSKNGTNSLDNLVVCCRDCNLEKDNDYIIDRLDLIKTHICWDKIKKSIEKSEQERIDIAKKEMERICRLDQRIKNSTLKTGKASEKKYYYAAKTNVNFAEWKTMLLAIGMKMGNLLNLLNWRNRMLHFLMGKNSLK